MVILFLSSLTLSILTLLDLLHTFALLLRYKNYGQCVGALGKVAVSQLLRTWFETKLGFLLC